ncbi:MAG: acylphosphatase [Acidobacteriota bacterium]|nr:acylphosphatase [Acidobacteriota bacterium]
MRIARRYLVEGRVQGVGFRFFTREAAMREGIAGWVRNTPEGQVEIVAEGESESMVRFEHAIRHGPPRARVEAVRTEGQLPSGDYQWFTVEG